MVTKSNKRIEGGIDCLGNICYIQIYFKTSRYLLTRVDFELIA